MIDDHAADKTFWGDANKDKFKMFFYRVKSVTRRGKNEQVEFSVKGTNDVVGKWKAVCLVFVIGGKAEQVRFFGAAKRSPLNESMSLIAAIPDPSPGPTPPCVGLAVNQKEFLHPRSCGTFYFSLPFLHS